MKKNKLLLAAAALMLGGSVWAQTDVTSTYLTNPGFDDGETGWTFNGSGTTYHGVAAYGSSTTINSATNINVDKFGKNSGNAAFSNAGWGDKSYYTQEVTLPAGSYKITFDVINRLSNNTGINQNYFGWVPNSGDPIYSSTKTFEYNVWYTLSVTFTLSESTTGKISCGMKSTSGSGSGAVAKLFIDNVKIYKTDEASAPTIANPIDYSDLINQTTWSVQQDDNATPTTSSALVTNITSGDWTGRYVERYRGVAGHYGKAVYQTVSVPAGVYQVQAACMSSSANGVDDAAGKKDGDLDVAYFYANSEELTYPLSDKKGYFRKHIVTLDADGTIEFGINTKVVGANWNAIGCATLIKVANTYNDYIEDLLSESIAEWNTAHTALEALDETALPDAAETVITTELEKSRPNTQAELESATAAMQALIDSYDGIKAAYDKASALIDFATDEKDNSTGDKTAFGTAISTATTAIETRTTAAALEEDYNTLEEARQTYITSGAQPTAGHVFDYTFKIADAAVTGTGWSSTGTASGQQYTEAPDNKYFDCGWNSTLNRNQTVESLPAGYYTLKAATRAKATEITAANVYANQSRSELNRSTDNHKDGSTDGELGNGWSWTEVNFEMRAAGNVTIGFYAQTTGQGWAGADDFHLYYKGNAVDNETANTLIARVAEGQMNSTVSENQTTALNTFKDSKIIENYDALENAIVAAKASVEDYATGKAAIDKADDILSKTNVYTTDAYTTFSEALETARTNYNDGTWADTDGADYKNSVFGTGWHSTATIDDLLTSAWDVNAQNWDNYHVNTWSTIDDSGNPNLVVPALEYWVSSTNKLADKVMIATVAVEPYETYSVSAFISMAKNSDDYETDAETAPVGVTVQTGEGSATTCTGTRVAETRFFEGTFVATGEADANGNLTFKIAVAETDASWIMFRDVKYTKQAAAEATEDEKNALLAAINTAKENTLGFEKDQFAPYNNIDALEKLASAEYAYANSTTKPAINGTKDALNNATWTANTEDVDAIYNGTFEETGTGNNPKGWTRSNNGWGQQITGLTSEDNGVTEGTTTAWYYNNNGAWQYGNDGVYTMPLAANQTYELSFKYRKHNTDWQTWMKASVLNSDDEGLEVVQYPGADNGTTFQSAKAYFTTGDAGNYILSIEQYGNAHLTDVSLVKAASATLALDEDETTYEATDRTYYETVTLERTIKANKWNTFCVPFDMTAAEIDKNAEVMELKSAEQSGENYTLTFDDATSIVAGKPYMVRVTGESDITSINLTGKTISSTITPTEADGVTFTGTYTNGYAPLNSFIISNNAFYLVDSEVTLKAFRGYITVGSGSSVKALNYVFDDDADGISTIENGQLTIDNAPIYNLAGQRIQKMQKGINIVNGKKILR